MDGGPSGAGGSRRDRAYGLFSLPCDACGGRKPWDDSGSREINPLRMEALTLSLLEFTAENVAAKPEAAYGVCGELRFKSTLGLGNLSVPGKARLDGIEQSLRARCMLKPGLPLHADVEAFMLKSPSLKLEPGFYGPLKTDVELRAGVAALSLNGTSPLRLDVEGARAEFKLGGLVRARIDASARELGSKSLNTEGSVQVNLTELAPLVDAYLPPGTRVRGDVSTRWKFGGRLPRPAEQRALFSKPPGLAGRLEPWGFIENLSLDLSLNGLNAFLPVEGAGGVEVSGMNTMQPVAVILKQGLAHVSMAGEIDIHKVLKLPFLGELPAAMPIRLSFSAEQQGLKHVHLTESMAAGPPYGIVQDLNVTAEGIDRLLEGDMPPPASAVLNRVSGELAASVRVKPGSGLEALTGPVNAKGELEAGLRLGLTAGKRLLTVLWLESPGLDITQGEGLRIEELKSHVRIDRQYRVSRAEAGTGGDTRTVRRLSREVVKDLGSDQAFESGGKDASRRLTDDLRRKLSGERNLRMRLMSVKAGDLAFIVRHPELQFRLDEGLPGIDHFQMDALGGTIQGDLNVTQDEGVFQMLAGLAFSGVRADELIPTLKGELPPEETEISGSLRVRVPLSENYRRVLDDLQFSLNLSHIGAKAMERFLYALDPRESNERIVQQRELLRIGTPKWIALDIGNGSLSLSGEVEAKGVRIDLPRIRRLNIANLALQQDLEQYVTRLGPVLKALRLLSADTIETGPEQRIRLSRSRPSFSTSPYPAAPR